MRLRGVLVAVSFTLATQAVGADAQVQVRDHRKKKEQNVVPAKPADPPPKQVVTVSGFAPASGPAGTKVTIQGNGFTPQSKVLFGRRPLRAESIGPTAIVIAVPEQVGEGMLSLRHPGVGNDILIGSFSVVIPPPAITGFSPASGTAGARVTITGTGFTADAEVYFGGARLHAVRKGETAIEVVIPANAVSQALTVRTRGGQATTAQPFQVLVFPEVHGISVGSGFAGVQVAIQGRELDAAGTFYLGQTALPVVKRAADHCVVTIPQGAVSGVLEWEAHGRRERTRWRFDVLLPPVLTSHEPKSGPPGSQVTLRGDRLSPQAKVSVGTQPCGIVARRGEKEIVIAIPAGVKGRTEIVVEDRGHRLAMPFEVIEPPPPPPPPPDSHAGHDHAHAHPHEAGDHHHHPHAHPHPQGVNHHHPY
ncbi:MAG: IPT/TIG domain-containing protein [Deltaproteobacteria bacterium]|nr:IPT/TIG domain-containing protein [Deltaproteobacteria bacterium]